MDTITCPVCGEENPASLEKCQHCNQRLRQSTSELNGAGKLIDSGQSPTVRKTSELEATLPAWLKNARQGEKKAEEKKATPASPPSVEEKQEITNNDTDDSPLDWLAGLDDENEDEDEEAADWLINLQGNPPPEEKKEIIPAGIPAVDEPITAGDIPTASTEEEAPIEAGELPDWISNLQENSAVSEAEPLPDLFEQTKSTQADNLGDAEDIKTGQLPDWLSTLSKESDSSPTPAETPVGQPVPAIKTGADFPSIDADEPTPDWMNGLQSADAQEASVEEPAVDPTSDDDLPDWMSGLQSADAQEASVEEPAIDPTSDDDLPDWTASSNDKPPVVEEEKPEEISVDSNDDLANWISDLDSTEELAPEAKESQGEETISAGDNFPDWMENLKPAETATEEAASEIIPESETSTESDIPDWLSSLPSEEFSTQDAEKDDVFQPAGVDEAEASLQESDPFADLTVDADEAEILPAEKADVPDWLSQMETPQAESVTEEVSEEISALATEEDPAWLDDLNSVDASKEVDAMLSPEAIGISVEDDTDEVFGIEMPDWLSTLSPEDVDEEEISTTETPDGEGDVSGVELPSWVQAMRPVADVVSDSSLPSDDNIVGTGPLAGLSGVLPAASAIGQMIKPKAHSVKLRVSESQQNSAAVLDELLAGESEPSPFVAPTKTSSIPVLRWLIAILLFLALGSSLVSQSKIVPSPDLEIPEVRDAIDTIKQLPAGGSALLIFDYEAGFSGEMKAIASPLVTELIAHGENLVVISTSPTGPALATNLFVEIDKQSIYEITVGTNYQNLGYLAGGASGMSNFISNPRQTIGDAPIWETPPLEKVTRFSDFSVIIILTDDVEKGRNWIEQKTVYFENNTENMPPFLMTISAQAEPIIYPYYASGQIEGLVSGLSGGATYERMQGQEGLGRKYWDSYSVGLLLAEILIAIGAMINFLASLRGQQIKEKEENQRV